MRFFSVADLREIVEFVTNKPISVNYMKQF